MRPTETLARPGEASTNDTAPARAARPHPGLSINIPTFRRRLAVLAWATAIPPSAHGPHWMLWPPSPWLCIRLAHTSSHPLAALYVACPAEPSMAATDENITSMEGAAKHPLQPRMATKAAALGANVLRPRQRL